MYYLIQIHCNLDLLCIVATTTSTASISIIETKFYKMILQSFYIKKLLHYDTKYKPMCFLANNNSNISNVTKCDPQVFIYVQIF